MDRKTAVHCLLYLCLLSNVLLKSDRPLGDTMAPSLYVHITFNFHIGLVSHAAAEKQNSPKVHEHHSSPEMHMIMSQLMMPDLIEMCSCKSHTAMIHYMQYQDENK